MQLSISECKIIILIYILSRIASFLSCRAVDLLVKISAFDKRYLFLTHSFSVIFANITIKYIIIKS